VPTRKSHDVDSIVTIAFDVFRRHGFDATSMADLADAAGVTKAALYHHLPSKEAILRHGLDRALHELEAIDREPLARQDSAIDSLRYVLHRVVEVELAFLPEASVLVRLRGNSDIEVEAVARRELFDRNIAAVLARGQAQGTVRADLDAKLATLLILGMITWVTEWYRPEGEFDLSVIADTIVGICLQGITRS
jgi:AcrR family transcriptional regulator